MGAGAGVCGCVGQGGTSIEVCTGTCFFTQSEHRQTDRDRQTGAYSAVLPVGFPSPCPAETPSALLLHVREIPAMVVLQLNGERERKREGEGEGVKEGKGRRKKDKKRKENQSRSSVLTCFSWQ